MPTAPPGGDFGTRAVWELPWLCGKILEKISKSVLHVGTFATSVSHLTDSQPDLHWWLPECVCTLIGPLQSWPSQMNLLALHLTLCSFNRSPQVAAAKPSSYHPKTPTFEWTISDQYDEFKLLWQSMESWFHLQAIPDEPDDKGAHLEYILNFLSTTGCQKGNQWTPAGVTTDNILAT